MTIPEVHGNDFPDTQNISTLQNITPAKLFGLESAGF